MPIYSSEIKVVGTGNDAETFDDGFGEGLFTLMDRLHRMSQGPGSSIQIGDSGHGYGYAVAGWKNVEWPASDTYYRTIQKFNLTSWGNAANISDVHPYASGQFGGGSNSSLQAGYTYSGEREGYYDSDYWCKLKFASEDMSALESNLSSSLSNAYNGKTGENCRSLSSKDYGYVVGGGSNNMNGWGYLKYPFATDVMQKHDTFSGPAHAGGGAVAATETHGYIVGGEGHWRVMKIGFAFDGWRDALSDWDISTADGPGHYNLSTWQGTYWTDFESFTAAYGQESLLSKRGGKYWGKTGDPVMGVVGNPNPGGKGECFRDPQGPTSHANGGPIEGPYGDNSDVGNIYQHWGTQSRDKLFITGRYMYQAAGGTQKNITMISMIYDGTGEIVGDLQDTVNGIQFPAVVSTDAWGYHMGGNYGNGGNASLGADHDYAGRTHLYGYGNDSYKYPVATIIAISHIHYTKVAEVGTLTAPAAGAVGLKY